MHEDMPQTLRPAALVKLPTWLPPTCRLNLNNILVNVEHPIMSRVNTFTVVVHREAQLEYLRGLATFIHNTSIRRLVFTSFNQVATLAVLAEHESLLSLTVELEIEYGRRPDPVGWNSNSMATLGRLKNIETLYLNPMIRNYQDVFMASLIQMESLTTLQVYLVGSNPAITKTLASMSRGASLRNLYIDHMMMCNVDTPLHFDLDNLEINCSSVGPNDKLTPLTRGSRIHHLRLYRGSRNLINRYITDCETLHSLIYERVHLVQPPMTYQWIP
ncbi:hypothetical protein SAMD00019534_018190 [Acytostelium subglobosum LB1]|uniref:hypothetical protein n=1 Tax=Acytostelium subglobosum LB1 TaxID=1410327 RepID=UPI0006451A8F|nr:hypothetical protein SAMD00019534_018190 [Acytostelium subglobosum LB1]GAM18644.1 hypothetical protein SAMD00019534_018190 [Acytostelium subglobosum LB1]|eukprot:XP_012757864.1 hypothetical protein SAMD00019534_018190 [Acytostelium subglobosum LB1]